MFLTFPERKCCKLNPIISDRIVLLPLFSFLFGGNTWPTNIVHQIYKHSKNIRFSFHFFVAVLWRCLTHTTTFTQAALRSPTQASTWVSGGSAVGGNAGSGRGRKNNVCAIYSLIRISMYRHLSSAFVYLAHSAISCAHDLDSKVCLCACTWYGKMFASLGVFFLWVWVCNQCNM